MLLDWTQKICVGILTLSSFNNMCKLCQKIKRERMHLICFAVILNGCYPSFHVDAYGVYKSPHHKWSQGQLISEEVVWGLSSSRESANFANFTNSANFTNFAKFAKFAKFANFTNYAKPRKSAMSQSGSPTHLLIEAF